MATDHFPPLRKGSIPLSPASTTITAASSVSGSILPRPRETPLKPTGNRESELRRNVDAGIQNITRRWIGKYGSIVGEGDRQGYNSFKEVAQDIHALVDEVWMSGTPSLQVPYLLSLAGLGTDYLDSFPPSPRHTFPLLKKLDYAFASLLRGKDLDTDATLPGFTTNDTISMTQKVRIRSLAEQARVKVVNAFEGADVDEHDSDDDATDNSDDYDMDMEDGITRPWDMEIAKVFDRTIVELATGIEGGENLGFSKC